MWALLAHGREYQQGYMANALERLGQAL